MIRELFSRLSRMIGVLGFGQVWIFFGLVLEKMFSICFMCFRVWIFLYSLLEFWDDEELGFCLDVVWYWIRLWG